jgi:oligoendopeptidase F
MEDQPLGVDAPRRAFPGRDDPPAWDLAGLYASPEDPALDADLSLLEIEAGCNDADEDPPGPDRLARREALEAGLRRVLRYADLLEAQGDDAPALRARARRLESAVRRRALESDLALGELERLPLPLSRYEFLRARARRLAPTRLGHEGETVAAKLDDSAQWADLHARILAGMKAGRPPCSVSELRSRLHSPDAGVRRDAAESLGRALHSRRETLARCLAAPAGVQAGLRRLRGLDHWLDETCLVQGIPRELADQAVRLAADRAGIAREFFERKRRALGLDILHEHDRLAPWPGAGRRLGWSEARRLVLDAFESASPELARIARQALNSGRVHARPNGGLGGPFCLPADHRPEPFLRLHFHGRLEDALTLAHELGHAVHHVLAHRQGPLQDTPAPVFAETMGCLAEELLLRRMQAVGLPEAPLLRLERAMTLVFRQTALLRLEAGLREAGTEPSPDDLDELWAAAHRRIHGDSLRLGEPSRCDWALVPHFHFSPGYVLAYILGRLAAADLARRLAHDPPDLAPRIMETMAQGLGPGVGDQYSRLGLDSDEPRFLESSLDELGGILEQLPPLANLAT